MDRCEFEDNLVYKTSSRTARVVAQRNRLKKKKKKVKEKKNDMWSLEGRMEARGKLADELPLVQACKVKLTLECD